VGARAGDLEAALTAYEQDVFLRSATAATDGDELHELLFGENAPQSLVDAFTGQE
jgi:hypothetical protein